MTPQATPPFYWGGYRGSLRPLTGVSFSVLAIAGATGETPAKVSPKTRDTLARLLRPRARDRATIGRGISAHHRGNLRAIPFLALSLARQRVASCAPLA